MECIIDVRIGVIGITPLSKETMLGILSDFKSKHVYSNQDLFTSKVTVQTQHGKSLAVQLSVLMNQEEGSFYFKQ